MIYRSVPDEGYTAVPHNRASKESDVRCTNGADNTSDIDGCGVFIASSTLLLHEGELNFSSERS
ncbi:hypothetical protein I8752_28355 [Nostocaceae cyanobacterium CENA369]|uniref:Uncharacterized protein n=1 Tax=Dendronalium phyllosphericum CENA369 TaxID=1725256 RepID=A0A8J7IAR4_9NOST|nr:hypothetical protein [Dendronalium phyllosphericum]MBH8576833.1 hypothetical protein [Dendronalium phyllosphericum CENA369]